MQFAAELTTLNDAGMCTATPRRTYDHRIRELACQAGDLSVAPYLGVPKATMASWLRRGMPDVVTMDGFDSDIELRAQVVRLQRRVRTLAAVVRVVIATMRALHITLDDQRLPSAEQKTRMLSAIRSARQSLKLKAVLKIIGLSPARYHSWNHRTNCALEDRSSCPRSVPTQLTAQEVRTIRELATSTEYRHMSVRALCLFAQRTGKVFASAGTWLRLIRSRGWRRPRTRVHPPKPTVGVRATRRNEFWHIDVTVIRLLDDTRVYLHAIIDNFSRRILAWKLARRIDPANTCAVLLEAGEALSDSDKPATFIADSGVENINSKVDGLLSPESLKRILAQVDVAYSNSMIEAFWRSLKHGWLFLNRLDTFSAVEKLSAFYVQQHNSVMPHAAFDGQTPDDMYFGTNAHLPDDLRSKRARARDERLRVNRTTTCGACVANGGLPENAVMSDGLQLHSGLSSMS